jgi:hypothetical protein
VADREYAWQSVDKALVLDAACYIEAHPGCQKREIVAALGAKRLPGPTWSRLTTALQRLHLAAWCYYPTGWFAVRTNGPDSGWGHRFSLESVRIAEASMRKLEMETSRG